MATIAIDPVSRVAGPLALHGEVDAAGNFSGARASTSVFRGYEIILRDRDVRDAIFISSRACGICGAAHSLASAQALDMMFGVRPPQYGVVIRNVLMALDCLIDHPLALYMRAGPDYSEPVVRATNPELWARAEGTPAAGVDVHGLKTIGAIMTAMTRFTGELTREALAMSRWAREAFVLMGGKYPHPQTIVPGGISSTVDPSDLSLALLRVVKFLDYSRKTAAVWDDLVNFLFEADARYRTLGAAPANFIDLGLCDDPDYYDGTYERAGGWAERRWMTPGAVLNGRLQTTNVVEIDAGIEEFIDNAFYDDWTGGAALLNVDPLGNAVSARHPWNKQTLPKPGAGAGTWSTSPRWRGNAMETGAAARLYITALSNKLPHRGFQEPSGSSIRFGFPQATLPQGEIEWRVPEQWGTLERNRARAYALAQATLAAYENVLVGFDLARIGGPEAGIFTHYKIPSDHVIGVGYGGGPRGYITHHVEVDSKVIRNYQIVSPSSFIVSARGPLEAAITASPSLATAGHDRHIDMLRTVRSYDLCMSCSSQ
jgi:hydrogenase large subunit